LLDLKIKRTVDDDFVNKVEEALSPIPDHLSLFLRDKGIGFYLLNTTISPRYIGIKTFSPIDCDQNSLLGRDPNLTSCCSYEMKDNKIGIEIRLFDRKPDIIRHELGHALDAALDFISYQHIFKGEPLDWYAAINPQERFAQAFDAYFTDPEAKIHSEFTHTKLELFQKEPDLFQLIDAIVKGTFR
jgi:hypothetical protein